MQIRNQLNFLGLVPPALTLAIGSAAVADLNYVVAPAPGGFVQACASPSSGGAYGDPGQDAFPYFNGSGADRNEFAFSGGASASASSSYSSGDISNSSSGDAGLGFVRFRADNSAPWNSFFAAACMNGGWSDMITIDAAGLTGQAGVLQFAVKANGVLAATGIAGASTFVATVYKDDMGQFQNEYSSVGNSDVIGWSLQYAHWSVATAGSGDENRGIAGYATFAVPFTFGTPFKLSVCAQVRAGMRSSAGFSWPSTSTANFMSGFTWDGITAVYHAGAPISGYKLSSASGTNWANGIAVPPETDLNGDGTTDSSDLAILLGDWGTPDSDLNGDGTTDSADLAILLSNWGN
ncbi:MAG: hypothetical protein LW636_10970 [Planctomycetaceae bacterium]|jgi:hypothetical protein|nr:hypothetical protein [Planctomycetaceae bacterium]